MAHYKVGTKFTDPAGVAWTIQAVDVDARKYTINNTVDPTLQVFYFDEWEDHFQVGTAQLEITRSTILVQDGSADNVYLYTNLPSTMPKVTAQPLILQFHVEKGKGEQYVMEHFSIKPEIIVA